MSDTSVEYRYFITNIVTNQVIAEVPLTGVSYERGLKDAGSFSGTLSLSVETEGIDVYNTTLPGKNAIYVVRNGVCVWGGVIWSRSYDVVDKSVSINANEFTSYFQHRKIWKTWNLNHDGTWVYVDPKNDQQLIVELAKNDKITIEKGVAVELSFLDKRGYNLSGHFRVNKNFYNASKITVDIEALQWNVPGVSHTFQTKKDGIYDVVQREVTQGSKEVKITTDEPHMLSVGDEISITNLDSDVPIAQYKTYKSQSAEYPIAPISSTSKIIRYWASFLVNLTQNAGPQVYADQFVITGIKTAGISVGAKISQLTDVALSKRLGTNMGAGPFEDGFDCRVTKILSDYSLQFSAYSYGSSVNTAASRTGPISLKFENNKSGYVASTDNKTGQLTYSFQPKNYAWAGKIKVGSLIKTNGIKSLETYADGTAKPDKVFGDLPGTKTRFPPEGGSTYTAVITGSGDTKKIQLTTGYAQGNNVKKIKPGMLFYIVSQSGGAAVSINDSVVKDVGNPSGPDDTANNWFTLESMPWPDASSRNIRFDIAENEYHKVSKILYPDVVKTMADYYYASQKTDFVTVPALEFKRSVSDPLNCSAFLYNWNPPKADATFTIIDVETHDYPYTKSKAAVCANTETGEYAPIIKVIDSKTFVVNSSCEAKYTDTSTKQTDAKIAWNGRYQASMYTHTDTYEQVRYFLGKVYEDFVSIKNNNPFLSNLEKTQIKSANFDGVKDVATISTGFQQPVYSKIIYIDYNSGAPTIVAKIGLPSPYSPFDTTEDVGKEITITGSDETINGTFFIRQIGNDKDYVYYKLADSEQNISSYALTNISSNGTKITYTTSANHNIRVGQFVTVGGSITKLNVNNVEVESVTSNTLVVSQQAQIGSSGSDSDPKCSIFTSDRLTATEKLPLNSSVITFGKHDLSAGNNIEISGLTKENYDGTWKVSSVPDPVSFTYKPSFESLKIKSVKLEWLVDSYVVTIKLDEKPDFSKYSYMEKSTKIKISNLGSPYDGTFTLDNYFELSSGDETSYFFSYKISGANTTRQVHPLRSSNFSQRTYGTPKTITFANYVAEIGGTKTKLSPTGRGTTTYTVPSHGFSVNQQVVVSNIGGEFTQLAGNSNLYSQYIVTVSSVANVNAFTVNNISNANNESLWKLKNNSDLEIGKSNTTRTPSSATITAYDGSVDRPDDIYPVVKIDDLPTVNNATTLTVDITGKAFNAKTKTVYLQLASDPGFAVGQTVFIEETDDIANKNIFNGYYTISEFTKWTDNKYQLVYNSSDKKQKKDIGEFDKKQKLLAYKKESTNSAAKATVYAQVIVGSYGSFTENSDPQIEFSTYEDSGNYQRVPVYFGHELKIVGEYLSEYSDKYIVKPGSTKIIRNVYGFEYRIDCVYDQINSTFRRIFTFLPITYPNPPVHGEVSPPSRFGADKIVFEYPGNISNLSLEESAEEASTRFFMVGSDGGTGTQGASKSYVGVAHKNLLADNWPLLDSDENNDKLDLISEISENAYRYLNETKPPSGTFQIGVVGNLDPVVNTYQPGDWCSIIVNDKFIKDRLASDLEPRNDVIVRKIISYSVEVPDAPSVPENVSISLITEWDVDKRGN